MLTIKARRRKNSYVKRSSHMARRRIDAKQLLPLTAMNAMHFTTVGPMLAKSAHSSVGPRPPSNSLSPCECASLKQLTIGSPVFAQSTRVPNTQTLRHTRTTERKSKVK